MPPSSLCSRTGWPLLFAVSIGLAGCSEELGPVPLNVTNVRGSVRDGRRPVTGGWVEFFPVDGTVGNLRSGRLAPDGSFTVSGVAVGRNLVRFVNARADLKPVAPLFGSMQTPIRRDVVKDSTAPIEIDLIDEYVSMQRPRESSADRPLTKTGKSR
jgi:hypothetical protein